MKVAYCAVWMKSRVESNESMRRRDFEGAFSVVGTPTKRKNAVESIGIRNGHSGAYIWRTRGVLTEVRLLLSRRTLT